MTLHIHPHAAECPRRQDAPGGRAEQARHLSALADRCEKATGPDRELDALIYRGLAGFTEDHWFTYGDTHYTDERVPFVTASLDAAMTLVPEGWRVAEVGETVVECSDPWAVRLFERCKHDRDSQKSRGDAATFALALCAASLRARAAMERGDG